MAKTLLLIVNPRAGRTRSMAPMFDAAVHFCEAGYHISIRRTDGLGRAVGRLGERAKGRYIDKGTAIEGSYVPPLFPFCEAGYHISIRRTAYPGHAAEIVESEGGNFDRIVCCGGVGTLQDALVNAPKDAT